MTQAADVLSVLGSEKVRSQTGEDLGEIEDFMLDIDSGRIAFAMLALDHTLGFTDKLFAVPPAALTRDASGEGFMLDAERSVLERAPAFRKSEFAELADPALRADIYAFYGYTSESAV